MSLIHDDSTPVELVDVPPDGDLFEAVVDLGDRCRATVGFFPRAAFADKAAKKTIVGALVDSQLVGYASFDLTRRCVRLVHLCVAHDMRKRGIARLLINHLSERYADYPGILARCRNDYMLAPAWIQLGFRQRKEVVGRSHEGHLLTVWWRDHGHPTLFSELAAEPLLQATIDLCILQDLACDKDQPEATDTPTLIADHLADRLKLASTSVLAEELATLRDDRRRQSCVRFAATLADADLAHPDTTPIEAQLRAAARRIRPDYPSDRSEAFDLRHVAATIASGESVFVTRDEWLIEVLAEAASGFGVKLLTPADVIVHLDELAAAASFRPAALAGTAYRRQRIGTGHDNEITQFVNRAENETAEQLFSRWRRPAEAQHERFGVYDPDDTLVAAWVIETDTHRLHVPLLRVGAHRLADTLARQVLSILRTRAREDSLRVITISDPYLGNSVRTALAADGFAEVGRVWHGFCIDVCGDAQSVEAEAVRAASQTDLPAPIRLRSSMPTIAAAMVERAWWPAKILDADLRNYLVPIQQRFSSRLFGTPNSLFYRDADLGLSREHVYYRSVHPVLQAPARILWYMSGTGQKILPQGVFACSQLDDVVIGTPDDLHERFKHLGVWDLDRLREAADGKELQALRFSNTELLDPGVPLKRLRALGHHVTPGPSTITPDLFEILYREGHRT